MPPSHYSNHGLTLHTEKMKRKGEHEDGRYRETNLKYPKYMLIDI